MILWGQEQDDFTNFGRASNAVFRIMLGDYDWDELTRVGRQQAGLWFWAFTWLVNLIMLNMLLAIVMDVYAKAKSARMLRRCGRRRARLPPDGGMCGVGGRLVWGCFWMRWKLSTQKKTVKEQKSASQLQ